MTWNFRFPLLAGIFAALVFAGPPSPKTFLQHLPIRFEKSPANGSSAAGYYARAGNFALSLDRETQTMRIPGQARPLVTRLLGASKAVYPEGIDAQSAKTNYFTGTSSAGWRTGVSSFARVRYTAAYPGIDLVFYGQEGLLEYDFVVAPGASPAQIAFQIDGADQTSVDAAGNLVVKTDGSVIRWQKPVLYQQRAGKRVEVAGSFHIAHRNQVRFTVGAYDHSQPLTIDPVLSWNTYFGGAGNEAARGIGVDAAGNVYIAGYSTTQNLPVTPGAFQTAFGGQTASVFTGDAFVAKFTPAGTLAYLTYLGGSGDDIATALAVDAQGNVYVTGYTNSANFPVTQGVLQSTFHGTAGNLVVRLGDAFIAKLNPAGSSLLYSTYLGGSSDELASAIAIDGAGDAYITGATLSTNFPTTTGVTQPAFRGSGGQPDQTDHGAAFYVAGDAFVAEINPQGTHLVFATYLGGSLDDTGLGIALDGSGNVYVTGVTLSNNFPTTPGSLQTTYHGNDVQNEFFHFGDGFLTKLSAGGTSLQYSTYFGGTGDDAALAVAVDASGNAYIVGCSTSPNLPVTQGALQRNNAGPLTIGFVTRIIGDAFVAKFNPTGSALVYGTYLGGTSDDVAYGIQLDASGQAYVTGRTASANFPLTSDAAQSTFGGSGGQNLFLNIGDAFLAVLNSAGSAEVYGTFAGGSLDDVAQGVVMDATGNVYIAGNTLSSNFPVTSGAYQVLFGGASSTGHVAGDAFITKYSGFTGGGSSPTPTLVSPANGATGVALTAALTWTAASGATSYDVYFGTAASPPLVTSTSGTSYTPAALAAGITYSWKIVAQGPGGPASSPTWSFTTGSSGGSCTGTLDSGGQAFAAGGGLAIVNVTANCAWTTSGAPSWVNFTTPSGNGSGLATYVVASNPGGARSATMTIAGVSYLVEQQAVTISGLNPVGTMPHIAAEENWTTTFTLVNKSQAAAQARLSFYSDPSGLLPLPLIFPQQPLPTGALLASSIDRPIASNASLVVTSAGPQTPPVQIGSAQLAATGAVDGFAIFHLIPGAQEAVVPLETRNASSYLLAFDNTNGVVLGVAVANISPFAASVPVVLRSDTGAVIGTSSVALSPNGHTSFVLSTQFPATANQRGTIEFDTPSGGQISVLGIRTTPMQGTTTLTTIPALANVGTGGGSIAHLASGNGWQTTFVLINAGASTAQTHLKFFADVTGNPLSLPVSFPQTGSTVTNATSVDQSLAAGATLVVQSTGVVADPLLVGSAQLTANGNVSGFVIFRYNPNGQEAVVPLESRGASGYVLAFDNTAGTATGVAINSVSSQTVTVPVVVRNDAGVQIATDTLTMAPNAHLSFTLAVDKYPSTANIRGTIEFDTPAGAQIGALGIRIPVAHTFTTLPALAK